MGINRIKEINIKYIKWIDDKSFVFDLFPNKPHILVAPNWFWKSSFAKAFSCMNQNKINIINKDDCYENKEDNNVNAEVSIKFEENDWSIKELKASNTYNHILWYFDVHTINTWIIPKAKNQNFWQFHTSSKASLEVPTIILKNTIPSKSEFVYNSSTEKANFWKNWKILINLSNMIKKHSSILRLINDDKFKKLENITQTKKIENWLSHINSLNWNKESIISQIDISILWWAFDELIDIIDCDWINWKEKYILLYQIHKLYISNKSNIINIKKYYNYLLFKNNIEETLESIGPTWKAIKPKEKKNKLILEFPDIRNISNWQRDSIIFLAKLLEIEEKLNTTKPLILIVDEIFDYLDDANLIICQYYITKFIDRFKKNNKQIIPIMMTHIDPYYFKWYVFKNQKIYFLNRTDTQIINKDLQKIIANRRKNNSIKNILDKYFLHYHSSETDNYEDNFKSLWFKKELWKIVEFKTYIKSEFDSYVDWNRWYDPLAVCTYLRREIEKYCYQLLDQADKEAFLETYKTKEKLNFTIEKGIDVPDLFFLLGIIYNNWLHINTNEDWITPLRSKLNNLFIKNMIKETKNDYFI